MSRLRGLTVTFLAMEGSLAAVWWSLLIGVSAWRRPFLPSGAPDAMLIAFLGPDLILYIGGALASAYALATGRKWGSLALCLHVGAAMYAGLYSVTLAVLAGRCWPGALLMAPSLVVLPVLLSAFAPLQGFSRWDRTAARHTDHANSGE